jgi:tight adherence protein C
VALDALPLLAAAAVLCGFAAGQEILLRDRDDGLGRRVGHLLPRFAAALAARGWLNAGSPSVGSLRGRIARAGLSNRVTPEAVLVAKSIGATSGVLVGLIVAPAAPGRLSWLVLLAMPVAGFIAPDAVLDRRARMRRERLVSELPDALDLLSVSVAAGRSAAAGFADLAGAGEGPLATELAITVAELSCGAPQERALDSLRERVPGSEMAALNAAIERSRRYGSPLADQLRRQSTSLRRDQRRALEERAARAAPKIQLVVALVLVPSVLLMIVAGLAANADRLLGGY